MKISVTLQRIIKVFLILIVLGIFFQPDIPFVITITENAIWIIFSLLLLSIFFLITKNINLVYFSMFSASILTLILKDVSNENLMFRYRSNNASSLYVMHYNVFNIEGSRDNLLNKIKNSDPHIISFEELDPSWHRFLIDSLKKLYPNYLSLNRADVDSKLVFSKSKFISKDTFLLSGHPQLDITIKYKSQPIKILLSYIQPSIGYGSVTTKKNQIDELVDYINSIDFNSLIVLGEFNQVYWDKSIRNFLYKTKLNNARRSVSFSKRKPYDHIFYSNRIKCVELNEVYDENSNHIGIEGRFKVMDIDESNSK